MQHVTKFVVNFVQDIFDSNNTRFERLTVDGSDDIYAPIRQSTGPKLVTRTNDRIEMSGYLHFRSKLSDIVYLLHLCIYPEFQCLYCKNVVLLMDMNHRQQSFIISCAMCPCIFHYIFILEIKCVH